MKSRATKKKVSTSATSAMATFEANLGTISHWVNLSTNYWNTNLHRSYARLTKRFTKQLEDDGALSDLKEVEIRVNKIAESAKSVNKIVESVKSEVDNILSANRWRLVILVTCVEAYLQDVLTDAARLDSSLMKNAQQSALYLQIVRAASLDELELDVRTAWARHWLENRRGPAKWVKSLTHMGARGYPKNLEERMERLWGVRHLIVHRAGRADRQFMDRHPEVVKSIGDMVPISNADFTKFLDVVRDFLEPTEKYFLARFPVLGKATR